MHTVENPSRDACSSLHAAQARVMAKVPYLRKTSSAGLNYTFASEADLIRKVRTAMIEEGLTITPIGSELLEREDNKTKSGSTIRVMRFLCTFLLVHWPSGASMRVQTIGEAMDTSDKACNKCMTIALKYALRQMFLIETGDDPDLVAQNRDDPKVKWMAEVSRQLEACQTVDAVDERLEKYKGVDQNNNPLFSDEQLEQITVAAINRKLELRRKG